MRVTAIVHLTVPFPSLHARVKLVTSRAQGYLIVKDYFTPEELKPSMLACEALVEDVATKLYDAGKIKSQYMYTYEGVSILRHCAQHVQPGKTQVVASM